ncbi:MAG: hypothetical protein AAB532_03205 [Patescibacteria group bacterium]
MDLNKDLKDIHLNINSTTFNILYRKYKSFILPVIIIIVCVILLFLVIFPQIKAVLDAKEKEVIERQKLEVLKNNYNLLQNMNLDKLNTELAMLSRTLPPTKDFAGIINSISDKSVKAGVRIGDFEFTVGNISKDTEGTIVFPSIQITLDVVGEPESVLNFVRQLYRSMPLCEITTIEQGGKSARIKIQFFYKAFPQGPVNKESPIVAFASIDTALINELSSWGDVSEVSSIPLSPNISEESSGSASLNASSSAQ